VYFSFSFDQLRRKDLIHKNIMGPRSNIKTEQKIKEKTKGGISFAPRY